MYTFWSLERFEDEMSKKRELYQVILIKFRGNDRVNEGGSSFNSKILPNRTCIFQEKERRGDSHRNVNIKGQSIVNMSTKKFRRVGKWPESTRTIKTTRKVKRLLETFVTKNHDVGFRFICLRK